ncbi:MAG: glycine--tRNA ligase [Patescibacteria group bacterium]
MTSLETIVSLAKRRGFIFPGSDIYGGLAGTWDYGPLGVALKNNIKNLWWQKFVTDREDMYGVDTALLMNARVWEASGHVAGFSDPLVECKKCKKRFRADHVDGAKCPECGGVLGESRQFNMMFKTHVGAMEDSAAVSYLRPETAQGIFVNFKNIVDVFHPKLPFGIAQVGKAFRNEITPRDFIFRMREFEQMEVEYFVRENDWQRAFEEWRMVMLAWCESIGLDMTSVSELEIAADDRAHYSKRTIDFEFEYPFGKKELYGLAYRTDYDLTKHMEYSSKDLEYFDEETKERLKPHVIEPSLGVERTILALLVSAYREDEIGGDKREYLAFKPSVAPIKAAVFPLVKNKPDLVAKAREVYTGLKKEFGSVMFDDNGNIGKRYRRQDEIGTPWCVTVDYQTLEDGTVTVRDRDTAKQERIVISEVAALFREKLI